VVTVHDALPITTPARTLLDAATVLPERLLERAVNEAERLGLCSPDSLSAYVQAERGQAGAGRLRVALGLRSAGRTLTRSELEERFLSLVRRRGLPQPLLNAPLYGLTVDFLWSGERVVVEVDGRGSHGTRRAFQDDRDRDTLLAARGYVTLRFTWWDVTRREAVVAHRVKSVLGARRG
jgi:very-short-patch-repair endonuclease